jgi:hypothetical protein
VRLKRSEGFCYACSYDARHLARHPKQRVSRIAVSLSPDHTPDKDATTTKMAFRVETRNGRHYEKTTTC